MPGFGYVTEDGRTGWDTVYGLTRALQVELGITDLADNFGPTTERLYSQNLLRRQDGVTNRKFAILQGALWCKGYNPGYNLSETEDGTVVFNGVFDADVEKAIIELKEDAGLINPDGVVTVNIMKALMSMDSFKLLSSYGGTEAVREMQQKLNRKYEAYTGITPCDGVYGRNTNRALIYALQAEEGMPTDVANANFGVTTRLCCPEIPYARNSSSARRYPGTSSGSYYSAAQITAITELLQFALLVNGHSAGAIDGEYGDATRQALYDFQEDMKITPTGYADKTTWLSLFISCGDTSRSALAADCATQLTAAKAKTLYDNGYRYIGRYLTGNNKKITRSEAQIIFDAGLKFFPILSGYIFDGWYENGELLYGVSNEYEITVDSNRTLEARFKENDLQITDVEIFGTLAAGETISFTVSATGGVQPWQWEFYIQSDNEVVYSDNAAIVNFMEWTPSQSGTYDFLAFVTDATGKRISYRTQFVVS